MTSQPTPTRRAVELQLVKRAWTDAAFAQQLQEDPRRAIEAAFGIQLPGEITIQVLQETPATLYLVVPPAPDVLPEGELTDADLEGVAGGESAWGSCGNCSSNCGALGCIEG